MNFKTRVFPSRTSAAAYEEADSSRVHSKKREREREFEAEGVGDTFS
jgi:hypothetical protein